LVGVNFAKGLAMSLGVPLIPVHHLRSHIAANYLIHKELKPPFLCLTVSGGNSILTEVKNYTEFEIIGGTTDDASGECFDKCARALGLPYPGGVNLDKIATQPDHKKYPLHTPHTKEPYDFSFSGLKTAVLNLINNLSQKGEEIDVPVMCATLRDKVTDILVDKTIAAADEKGYKKIVMAGGVSANSALRYKMEKACKEKGFELYYPPLSLCGDNAAMIAAQGYYEYQAGKRADLALNACAAMPIDAEF
jgi:N6-L-threonylcarbamoyladenine synthase